MHLGLCSHTTASLLHDWKFKSDLTCNDCNIFFKKHCMFHDNVSMLEIRVKCHDVSAEREMKTELSRCFLKIAEDTFRKSGNRSQIVCMIKLL